MKWRKGNRRGEWVLILPLVLCLGCGSGGGSSKAGPGGTSGVGDYHLEIVKEGEGILRCTLTRGPGNTSIHGVSFALLLSDPSFHVLDSSAGPLLSSGAIGVGQDEVDPRRFFVGGGLPMQSPSVSSAGEFLSFRLKSDGSNRQVRFELEEPEAQIISSSGSFLVGDEGRASWTVTRIIKL